MGEGVVMCGNIHLIKSDWNAGEFTHNRLGKGQRVVSFWVEYFSENDPCLGVSILQPKSHMQLSLAELRHDRSATRNTVYFKQLGFQQVFVVLVGGGFVFNWIA